MSGLECDANSERIHTETFGPVDWVPSRSFCFLRMWEFYLCYCEGGFGERSIGLVQATRRASLLGSLA